MAVPVLTSKCTSRQQGVVVEPYVFAPEQQLLQLQHLWVRYRVGDEFVVGHRQRLREKATLKRISKAVAIPEAGGRF